MPLIQNKGQNETTNPILQINLLGGLRLVYGAEPITQVNTGRLQALLAYVLLHRQNPQPRQQLAFQFWPDSSEKQAHTNLRKLLFQLRNALPDPDQFLHYDHLTVQWRPTAPYTLDVAEIQALLAHAPATNDPTSLTQIVQLYQGELLPGCFDEWLIPIRQQLQRAVMETLEQLISLSEHQREYRAGIRYAQRLLGLDPLHEGAYRRCMQLHALNGDRAAALSLYNTCATLLQQELGVEPDEETHAIYQRLLSWKGQTGSLPLPRSNSPLPRHMDKGEPHLRHDSVPPLPQNRVQLAEWLPFTKFQPPFTQRDLVARLHLLAQLNNAVINHRLTLISAPAGSGKTTLLTQLAAAYPVYQQAWLRLDQHDNQPTLFLVALIRALTTLSANFGSALLTWIATAEQFSTLTTANAIQPAIGLLINEVAQTIPTPFTLVLDDCQWLEHPAIFAGLDYLLMHMPVQMRLLIATRHDPPLALDRLRGQGELAEFRFDQLAFTAQEATTFLNGQPGLTLTTEELQLALMQAQGWPAGLRLLATALSTAQRQHEHLSSLVRFSQHGVSQAADLVMNTYLLNEVLNHQSVEVRSFLLQTALLAELTPALCRALTGRADAADLLVQLYHANLFVTQVAGWQRENNRTTVYRYHDLFADFLRQRLQIEMPDQVAALHQRAALAETGLDRKLAHFYAGGWWESAAQLLSDVGEQMVQQGLIDSLYEWLTQLPSTVLQASPQLLYLNGICQWQRQLWDAAQATLLQALQNFQTTENREGAGKAMVHLASCAMFTGNFGEAAQWIEQSLDLPINSTSQVQVRLARFWLGYNHPTPPWRQVEQDFADSLLITQQTLDRATLRTFAVLSGAAMILIPSGLVGLEKTITWAWQQTPPPDPFWQMVLSSLSAWHRWICGQPDVAQQEIERCLALGKTFAYTFHGALHDLCLLRVEILSARAEYAAAHALLAGQIQSAQTIPMLEPSLIAFYFLQCRLYWQQGALAEAQQVYQQAAQRYGERIMPTMRACLPVMRSLLALGNGHYAEAESELQQALALESGCLSATQLAQPHVLRAYLHCRWKGAQVGLSLFAPLLAEHAQNNTPGLLTFAGACVIPLLNLAVQHNLQTKFALRVLTMLGIDNGAMDLFLESDIPQRLV